MVEDFLYYFETFYLIFVGAQFAYAVTILLLGETMMEYFEWGYYEIPESKGEKVINFVSNALFGFGYHFYKRLRKYNWFLRKIYFFGILILSGIVCIIVYQSIKYIFNLF
ncbi:hypothetical protein [Bacillus sp. CECT 9360]|uniref:hypothetical protein n=1 Tax=Bacillus sp. CECT 9360 TaxID=2845821 RepID=UPI001E2F1548|nr:hypothetical protein [Bacillus sp. CECT 9360]CAH0347268.1 hypothetical protein BCI9360_03659 [Bacillus sp. CECT 9360]